MHTPFDTPRASRLSRFGPAPLRDRRQWFQKIDGPILALWWIPAGHIPTVAEAIAKLAHLKEHGPTRDAFTFRAPFPPPGAEPGASGALDAAFCDWAS